MVRTINNLMLRFPTGRNFVRLLLGFVLALLFVGQSWAQHDSTLVRVKVAGANTSDAFPQLHFSKGYEERAQEIYALLVKADTYLKRELGVDADFQVAVLNENDWSQVWPLPYGIPYVSLARPWVVVMPAEPKRSVMYEIFDEMMGAEDAVTMIDNIGFHEVGHIYVSEYLYPEDHDGAPPVRWFDEYLAQYLAHVFLHEVAKDRTEIWNAFTERALEGPAPRYTSLGDFDAEYYGYLGSAEGSMNYGWYQSTFARHAADLSGRRGLEFIRELKGSLPWNSFESWTEDSVLEELNELDPSFRSWEQGLAKEVPRKGKP